MLNILEINPYVRVALRSEIPAYGRINRRIIFDYELLYIQSGELLLTYNETDFLFTGGELLLLCPNIPHSFNVRGRTLVQPHIHFDMQYDSSSRDVYVSFKDYRDMNQAEHLFIRENVFPNLARSPVLSIPDKNAFLKLFFSVVDAKEKNSLLCKSNMLLLLQQIIAENASQAPQLQQTDSGVASSIRHYIDSNCNQKLTLDGLARQFSYSKYYVERCFKEKYGISIGKYYNTKKLNEAVKLLETHTVSDTAQLLGYSSIYAFSRAFRNQFGVSPTNYSTSDSMLDTSEP